MPLRTPKNRHSAKAFEKALASKSDGKYILRLYVAGATARSRSALRRVYEICEAELKGNYELEVIDVYQQPTLAKGEQIIAAPTLIKKLPLPLRRLIGSMADEKKTLVGLDLRPKTRAGE